MCSMCDKLGLYSNLTNDPRNSLGLVLADEAIGFSSAPELSVQWALAKATDGMLGTGHSIVPPQVGALIVVPDNIPGDTSTTATLTVDAPSTISTTNTIGDEDFYKVTLTAGERYEIGMYAKDAGPNGVAHGDAYIEVYGPDGALLVSADGGASTLRNNVNSGFDVLLTFIPKETGTYYVNARAYDQDPVNGTTGDFVGDYELFVRTPTDNYVPYYDVDSPLYAIDWGTQVDRTSRNPDGAEGPRITGNEFTGVGSNPFGIAGKNVITYYFARQGEVFVTNDPAQDPLNTALTTQVAWGMEDWEKGAFRSAMDNFEKVADIVYVEVSNRNEADFVFITYNGTPQAGVLGRMSPPNTNLEGQAEFNRNGPGWTEEALVEGGFSFITLIHELGHGHGLAHPHDNGGRSGIMRGVVPEQGPGGTPEPFNYTHGDFSLNQGIYTMMSYESGWEESPYGQASSSAPYGWDAGPMAFDIAALQDKYGVNEDTATGNDTYVLKDVNAQGTFYKAIWDVGGTDQIVYSGARNANIDLRAATLQYEIGGGGFLSYAFGIHGGFTIANGVTIENAIGGSGNDVLTGNAAGNVLAGRDGDDVLIGGDGASNTMIGGRGNDTYIMTAVGDTLVESASEGTDWVRTTLTSYTLRANFENMTYTGTGNFAGTGNELANIIIGGGGNDVLSGLAGADYLIGGAGNDTLIGGSGAANALQGGTGDDTYLVSVSGDTLTEFAGEGIDTVQTTLLYHQLKANFENLTFTGAGNFTGVGNGLANVITGGAGNDLLNGGLGADSLAGGAAADYFLFGDALGGGNVDSLPDFQSGVDRILLEDSIFAALPTGALSASAFVTGTAAGDADDRIIYDSASGALYYDADGSGAGAALQFAQLNASTPLAASDFQVI